MSGVIGRDLVSAAQGRSSPLQPGHPWPIRTFALPPGLDLVLFLRAARHVLAHCGVADAERARDPGRDGRGPSPPLSVVDAPAGTDGAGAAELLLGEAAGLLAAGDDQPPLASILVRSGPGEALWAQTYDPARLDPAAPDRLARQVFGLFDRLAAGGALPDGSAAAGERSELKPEPASWAADIGEDLDWQDAQCSGLPEAPSPSRRRRGGAASSWHARRVLASGVAEALGIRAAECAVSREALVCAAWAALLHRISYQDDLLIGLSVPGGGAWVGGRGAALSPLRLATEQGEGFGAWSRRVAARIGDARRHGRAPSELLRRRLGLGEGDPEPLSVVFNPLPEPPDLSCGGRPVATRSLVLDAGVVHDLTLSVEPQADGALLLQVDCNRSRHGEGEASRLAGRMALLLGELGRLPFATMAALPLGSLPVMSEAELADVSERFADGGEAPPRRSLAELVTRTMQSCPEAPALLASDGERGCLLSYGELERRSRHVAARLLACGLRPGDVAAILLPRRVSLVVAVVACARIGVTYCPLEPSQPAARLAQMISASGAALLVTDESGARHVATTLPALLLGGDGVLPNAEAKGAVAKDAGVGGAGVALPEAVDPETIAYIIFTSGSTGLPKGVAVPHGAIAQQVQGALQQNGLGPGQSVVTLLSIAFDPSTLDIFQALAAGAKLVLLDEVDRREPVAVLTAVRAHQPALLQAPPSYWRALCLDALPDSLLALCGGEPFPTELLGRMRRLRGVLNAYGPTEAAVAATVARLDPSAPEEEISIGRPMPGYRVWILDRRLRPVPVGALGELCIGGGALAGGYVGQPEQTASVFVPNPLGEGQLYRTGDYASWRADGRIDIHGRIDKQVKILGHRIEPEEIEHALRELPWVADAGLRPRAYGRACG